MTKPTLLLTRPKDAARRFAATLSPKTLAAVDVVISPLLRIEGTGVVPDLDGARGVIFTSAQGVTYAPDGTGQPAYCVGERTAEQATAGGWQVAMIGQDAEDLLRRMAKRPPPGPLLHLSGRHTRGDIAARLTALGISTVAVTLYDQVLQPLTRQAQNALMGQAHVIAPLFSPRSASHFAEQAVNLRQVQAIALSPAVAAALGQGCAAVTIASAPTAREMGDCVENLLQKGGLP